jgi:hypothetical protein
MTKQRDAEIAEFSTALYRKTDLSWTVWPAVRELPPLARSLRHIFERQCNGFTDEAAEKRAARREELLTAQARELAKQVGAELYVQGDPRGCPLYLIFPGDVPAGEDVGAYYNRGVAVPS